MSTWLEKYNLGVFSVHTLDTPHHGSVAADIAVAANSGLRVASLFGPTPWLIDFYTGAIQLAAKALYTPADDDLTVQFLTNYNKKSEGVLPHETTVDGQTNSIKYFSYQGDVNLNGPTDQDGFGVINCTFDPCEGYFGIPVVSFIPQWDYRVMQRWRKLNLVRDPQNPKQIQSFTADPETSQPYGNDFAVSVPSAAFSEEQFTSLGVLWVNHSTLKSTRTGTSIRDRFAQNLAALQVYK